MAATPAAVTAAPPNVVVHNNGGCAGCASVISTFIVVLAIAYALSYFGVC